jgi:ABC-type transporter Mla MlaB component
MVASRSAILPAAERLTHEEACRLARLATRSAAQTVVLDVSRCADASTSAFARLILLRRDLLQVGRDIWLAGLCGRAESLFEVHRLDSVLPRLSDLPASKPVLHGMRSVPTTKMCVAG